MATIEMAVRAARELESLLETQLGAGGRGLHEKVDSVQERLPPELLGTLRRIATIRNRAVHEHGFEIDDPEGFAADVDRALAALRSPAGSYGEAARAGQGARGSVANKVGVALLAGGASLGVFSVMRSLLRSFSMASEADASAKAQVLSDGIANALQSALLGFSLALIGLAIVTLTRRARRL